MQEIKDKTKNIFINNSTAILLAIIFIFLAVGVFASETGQEIIGQKEITVENIDNTLLLTTDIADHNFEYRLEKIEEDDEFYYITYSFIDIDVVSNAWQYILKEKSRKVSKKSNKEIGSYVLEELKEENEKRVGELKEKQKEELTKGLVKRFEVTKYDGLIGAMLDLGADIIPGLSVEEKIELDSPVNDLSRYRVEKSILFASSSPANLTEEEQAIDYDKDGLTAESDNCPFQANPSQLDSDIDGIGDECDIDNLIKEALSQPEVGVVEQPLENEESSTTEEIIESIGPIEPENVEIIELSDIETVDQADENSNSQSTNEIPVESVEFSNISNVSAEEASVNDSAPQE